MAPCVRLLIFIIPLLLWPAVAYASGSVMMWGSYPQLVLGNFFIGLLEVYAVKRRFNTTLSVWIILLANYLSFVIGFILLAGGFTQLVGLDFWGLRSESGWGYTLSLFLGLVVAFIASVLVEWPFYYAALYLKKKHSRQYALEITVFAQCVSFAFIIIYLLIRSIIG